MFNDLGQNENGALSNICFNQVSHLLKWRFLFCERLEVRVRDVVRVRDLGLRT